MHDALVIHFLFRPVCQTCFTFPELLGLVSPLFHLVLIDQPVRQADNNEHGQKLKTASHKMLVHKGVHCSPTQSRQIILGKSNHWIGELSITNNNSRLPSCDRNSDSD